MARRIYQHETSDGAVIVVTRSGDLPRRDPVTIQILYGADESEAGAGIQLPRKDARDLAFEIINQTGGL